MLESRKAQVDGVAIIGMAGRFPGADDLEAYWRNLCDGVESVRFFSEAELEAAGVEPALLADEHYVRAGGVLSGVDEFDAAFFGYTPREAERMDPQQRLFLQAAWSAFEDAGYCRGSHAGTVGVFAGSSLNTYLLNNLGGAGGPGREVEDLSTLIGSDKDFLATRVSYHLDLTGPSVVVQSGCSTSLVAVVQACQSLLGHQCDTALAGGVTVRVPQVRGYLHVPEGTLSPDGHCRAFDADARGTGFGSGLGVVVLKRAPDAIADGDRILAVIRGGAINNDGASKLSYTAPSVDRQAAVIAQALSLAEVDPRTIGYVEAHGTGTALGDPVEVAALTRAFGASTERRGFCALGSVKTNIGHLDAASGIAGLIKTVLALSRRKIPPSLHFREPNPLIDFASSPFYVNTELREWESNGGPRRAGVSSFGVGGTNAHVVLEEAPAPRPPSGARLHRLIVLSAKTRAGLEAATSDLAACLAGRPDDELDDVAYTLQVGRTGFDHRRAFVCSDTAEARELLAEPDSPGVLTRVQPPGHRPVAFLFPGEESVHAGMGAELYRSEPVFREHVDACCESLRPHLGLDLREVLYPPESRAEAAAAELLQSRLAQPAVFVTEYALARLWMEWGLRPKAMLGRGVGELVAAHLAQVIWLEHALELVVLRGRWTDELVGEEAEAARAAFVQAVTRNPRRPPELPFVSEVTGSPITPADAIDPSYWERQRFGPSRTEEGLAKLLAEPARILLEVGPGTELTALARERLAHPESQAAIHSMPHPEARRSESTALLAGLGQLWLHGVPLDWAGVHADRERRRVALPTYPFERARHWVERTQAPVPAADRAADPKDWFYVPTWKRSSGARDRSGAAGARHTRWLVFEDPEGGWDPLVHELRAGGAEVAVVRPSTRFARPAPDRFEIDPGNPDDYAALFDALAEKRLPTSVLHLWLATPAKRDPARELALGLSSLVCLTDAFTARSRGAELELDVVTAGAQDVTGEAPRPARAAVLGACRVMPQEHPELCVRWLDVDGPGATAELLERVGAEIERPITDPVVALRGGYRWVPDFEAVELPSPKHARSMGLRERGVYLISGGLGGVGLTLAGFLAKEVRARLVLCGRSPASAAAASRIAELEATGAEVLVLSADVADRAAMERVLAAARERFGELNGVIHAAGVPGSGVSGREGGAVPGAALRPKVEGTLILDELWGDEPDFFVLASAAATALGGLGQAEYCGANAFLDAFALMRRRSGGPRVLSIGWDTWSEVGMAADASVPDALRERQARILAEGLSCEEGIEVFRRALAGPHAHVLVSTTPLAARRWLLEAPEPSAATTGGVVDPRPAEAPAEGSPPDSGPDEIERAVVQAWTQLLGIERVDPEDSFFEAGGNSLLATQMLARLRGMFPASELALRDLFDNPTIAGLIARIRETCGMEPAVESVGAAESDRDERSLRERVLDSTNGRADVLEEYLREQVAEALDLSVDALPDDGDLEGFDGTLLAAHLSWSLRRDLSLAVFPAEIRGQASIRSLARLLGDELARHSATSLAAVPAEPSDPADSADSAGGTPRAELAARRPAALPGESGREKNASMAFLLSAPRSGSTLLRLMLSAHPELFCPPELFLLDSESMRSWSEDPFNELFRDGLVRALMALRGIDYDEARAAVDELVEADAPVRDVYRMLQGQRRKLVDKTPTYALSLSSLHRAEDLFEEPRYVELVRHPFAVIESIVRNRLDRVRRLGGDSHATAERYWVRSCRNVAAFGEQIGGERLHRIRYEDLLREPEAVLRGVCDFLGVAFDRAVLDPYRHGRMFSGPGDPGLFERGAVDASLADAWKRVRLPRPLGPEAAELADALGYELPR